MKKKIGLIMALTMAMSIFAAGCGSDNGGGEPAADTSLKDLQAKGTLVVGVDVEFPPMGFQDATGNVVGFDIDLAKAVGEKLGVTVEIKPIDWTAKEMELNNGKIDVIWNGYTINKERNAQVEYTKPYLNNQQVIVVPNDSPIMTKADLAGKIVGAQAESSGLSALNKETAFKDTLAGVPEYNTYQYALLDLGTAREDAVVVDKVLIEYMMSQQPGKYRLLDETLGNEYYGIGCKKGAVSLREAIDTALDEMQTEGMIDEICKPWFSSNIVIRDVEKLTDADLAE